jgi:hypothetical protein
MSDIASGLPNERETSFVDPWSIKPNHQGVVPVDALFVMLWDDVGAIPVSLHLDVGSVQKDPAFTTEQPKQDGNPIAPCHAGIDRELVAERTVQDAHLIAWPQVGWQLDRAFALAI